MQPERRDLGTLLDIYIAAQSAISYIKGLDFNAFLKDRRTQKAVIYEIQTVGEAAKRLSKSFCEFYPEIDWSKMKGMRDKLVHDYDRVNPDIVWLVATERLPALIKQIEPILPKKIKVIRPVKNLFEFASDRKSPRSKEMKRRNFLQACALGVAASQIFAAEPPPSHVWAPESEPLLKPRPDAPLIIQKIELLKAGGVNFLRATTRDGRVGLALCDGGLEVYAPVLKKMVIPYFIGKDARDIETLIDGVFIHASNYKKAGIIFWSCVAWVEFSVLDLLGQATGKSIGALFGAAPRATLDVYNSSTARDTTPEQEAANFEKSQATRGCRALKWKIGGRMSNNADAAPGRSEKLIELMTKKFPDAIHYADANGSYDAPNGIKWGRVLADHGVKWLEEPCPFEDFAATKAVADGLDNILVTGGEQDTAVPKFKWMIDNRGVDVVQPDIVYNGGIIRAKRVARMAERAGMDATLHSPGTGIHQIYMIHFASSTPNAGPFQEYHINKEGEQSWSDFQVFVKDGKIPVPTAPGKGFNVDPALLSKAAIM